MVLVSHRYRFIYFKNYKAAGSSVESFFGQFCIDPANQASYLFKDKCEESITPFGIISTRMSNYDGGGNYTPDSDESIAYMKRLSAYYTYKSQLRNPATADTVIPNSELMWFNFKNALDVKEDLGDNIFNQYIKFCVIRNPYDVIVSSYHYDMTVNKKVIPNFKEYCINFFNRKGFAVLNDDSRIFLNNQPICQYYIRYENLEQDILMVLEKLGITEYKLDSLPKHKSSGRPDVSYQSYYDDETKALVYSMYKNMIDYFGYIF